MSDDPNIFFCRSCGDLKILCDNLCSMCKVSPARERSTEAEIAAITEKTFALKKSIEDAANSEEAMQFVYELAELKRRNRSE
jgi:hypothetical protein